jgi:dihydrofolate synthase / folylpolyglutamate synthase
VPPVSPASTQYLVPSGQWSVASGQFAVAQRYALEVLGERILVESPLVGRHQLRNIALAIAAAEELHNQGFTQITPEAIARGIRETRWPGRFQVVLSDGSSPEYVLDVAHNPAGAWALRSTLSAAYGERPVTMVFGVLRDKAVAEIAEILFPIAEYVIVTHANNPRSASVQEIQQAASRVAGDIRDAADVASALKEAGRTAGRGKLVVVTGSIYIVGEAMQHLGVRI